jgi:hypothetical protein
MCSQDGSEAAAAAIPVPLPAGADGSVTRCEGTAVLWLQPQEQSDLPPAQLQHCQCRRSAQSLPGMGGSNVWGMTAVTSATAWAQPLQVIGLSSLAVQQQQQWPVQPLAVESAVAACWPAATSAQGLGVIH